MNRPFREMIQFDEHLGHFQDGQVHLQAARKGDHWLALPVGNEGINLYIGILGMKLPSFTTKGQLDHFVYGKSRQTWWQFIVQRWRHIVPYSKHGDLYMGMFLNKPMCVYQTGDRISILVWLHWLLPLHLVISIGTKEVSMFFLGLTMKASIFLHTLLYIYIYMVAPPPRAHLRGRECITYQVWCWIHSKTCSENTVNFSVLCTSYWFCFDGFIL